MAVRNDIDTHLRKEAILPVYAILSQEGILRTEAVEQLRNTVLTQAPDFNRDEFRVGETPIGRVLEAAATLPMMAPRRYVHLCDIHKLKAADHAPLLQYLDQPSTSTVLCLSGEKIDQRTKLGQKLNKIGALFVLTAPKQQALAAWIRRRATARGCAIEADAAQLLADLVGVELGTLDMALEKAALHAGLEQTIGVEDVENTVAPTRVHSIFNLTDAMGERNLARASFLLRNALGGGEGALQVLGMMTRQFRQLLKVKDLASRGRNQSQIVQELGIPPFLAGPLLQQAKRYTMQELQSALEAAARADIRLKSSGLAPGIILDRLLAEVVAGPQEAA